MDTVVKAQIRDILEQELVPALGCTEPATFAYLGALARSHAPGQVEKIEIEGSSSMIKGVQYVQIPGSGGLRGGKLSTAMGVVGGDPALELEALSSVTPGQLAQAKELVEQGLVDISRVDNPIHSLYLMVSLTTRQSTARVAVAGGYTNLVYLEENGQVLTDRRDTVFDRGSGDESLYRVLSMDTIFRFATEAALQDLERVREAINMNCAIARDGMERPYGMEVGRMLRQQAGKGLVSLDVCNVAAMWGAAGVDARMGGSPLPAMSNCGSGNQGITCTAPVCYVGELLGCGQEQILRAVTVSNLVNIYVKTHTGKKNSRMSGACCAAVAAGGAGCGIACLLGADVPQLERILNTVLGNVVGLFCDGAKGNCALKVSSTLAGAVQAVVLAREGFAAGEYDGMVGADVPQTIESFYRILLEGMGDVKEVLYHIGEEKHGIM